MAHPSDVLIALNGGAFATTVAGFDRKGRELAHASVTTSPRSADDGDGVEQDLADAWKAARSALRLLAGEIPDLARRAIGLSITGQAGGTWLIDEDGDPVAPAMLWLDARPASIVEDWRQAGIGRAVHEITGSPLEASCQSAQLAWLLQHRPELVEQAATALQAKDWLYFCCTGELATDPTSGMSSYGDFANGGYDDRVLALLGLEEIGRLLPPMIDGTRHAGRMSMAGAAATGLREGMPVVLAPPDGIAAALAAGALDPQDRVGCTILGDAALHLRVRPRSRKPVSSAVSTVRFVMPGTCAFTMQDASAGLRVAWLRRLIEQLVVDVGLIGISRSDLADMLDASAAEARPGAALFHPTIGSRWCETGFDARARFTGLCWQTGPGDLMRGIYEGIAFAARDAHATLGHAPDEIRLGGALAAIPIVRRIFAASLGTPVRRCMRGDPAACGAAIVAAVALGQYGDVADALAEWVEPHLAEPEPVDPDLVALYAQLFETWRCGWHRNLEDETALREARHAADRAAGAGLAPAQIALAPASTGRIAPVTRRDSSEAR